MTNQHGGCVGWIIVRSVWGNCNSTQQGMLGFTDCEGRGERPIPRKVESWKTQKEKVKITTNIDRVSRANNKTMGVVMRIVKVLTEESRRYLDDKHVIEDPVWHATVWVHPEGLQTACSMSLTAGAEYQQKTVKRGGITCQTCLDIIKEYKKIKL